MAQASLAFGIPRPDRAVRDRFPVTVVSREGLFQTTSVEGWAESYDPGGLYVKTDAPLARGKKVDVRFKAPESLFFSSSGIDCAFPGEVLELRDAADSRPRYEVRLKWERPLGSLVEKALFSRFWRMGALVACALAGMAWLRWTIFQYFWYDPAFYFYTIAIGLFYMSRFYLSCVHRPPAVTGYEPTLSVVVSVRNEEDAIARTVESCFAARYPADKREVIVVDDGSTDGTAAVLAGLGKRFPELRVFSIPPSGKRHGMAKGVQEAKGELLVFVDSDAVLERSALRHIVCGFEDPGVGASSGYSGVENVDKNMLTRMQDVRYYISYELMKAPEGVFGCVTCCPGVLSAYRKEYVLKVLDRWLNQTFLGAPATFGDDRSLTNFILRDYRVLYNSLARCTTLVPETWGRYLTQQARWKKSWLRETLIAARIMLSKHPAAVLSFYTSAVCSVLSPFMVFRALWLEFTDQNAALSAYAGGLLLLGLTMGLFTVWRRPNRNWHLVWLLVLSQVLIMGPQTYYAILTMRKNHWGTR